MQHRQHMKAIQQQKSIDAQSIALDHESEISVNQSDVIQEYANLDFSDEHSDPSQGSNSSDDGELSAEKLKFLGVDRFPGPYSQKCKEVSETRSGFSPSLNTKKQFVSTQNQFHQAHHQENSKLDFNIDSFLNSRPSHNQERDRQKFNTGGFGKEPRIKERTQGKIKIFQKEQSAIYEKELEKNEERNQQVRNFIRNYGKRKAIREFYQSVPNAEQSISLITLPEPPEAVFREGKLKYLPGEQQALPEHQEKMIAVRYEQAKINFFDSFLPESLKIGSNPYNFLKYTRTRNAMNFLRVV